MQSPEQLLAYIFIAIFGAVIGSFLNVVIYRVPEEKSLLTPSRCPSCDERIKPYHNVPIFGWLFLRGRCSNCGQSIAWRYPAIELLTGVVFVLVYSQIGATAFLPIALLFSSAIIALIFIDADHMILPNVITYPMFVIAVIARVVLPLLPTKYLFSDMAYFPAANLHASGYPDWVASLAAGLFGALVGAGSLWLVGAIWKALRKVDAMGLGDVKLLLGIGALLGWRLTILTIFLAAFSGAVAGIIVVAKQKEKDLQAQIPFGIFLGAGAIISMLFGETIVGWYLSRFS